jgi:soluble lytic murein transglycosylase-like protein
MPAPEGGWKALAASPEEWKSLRYDDPRLDEFAHAVEDRYGLPRGVIEALKNAGERTPAGATSPKGAEGIMQFIPSTRRAYQHNPDDPFESIDAAGRYMKDVIAQYKGNVMAAVADYNGGPRAGNRVLQGLAPPAAETQNYLKRIRQYMNTRYGGKS